MVPRIGVVSRFDRERQTYVCEPAYVRAIEAAEGLPVILPYLESPDSVPTILEMLDGVLLTGGTDFDPAFYGEPVHPALGPLVPERDMFEFALTRAILERDVPVLGVCRGLQWLNVAAGGSLHVDLKSCIPNAIDHRDGTPLAQTVHTVAIEANSRLAELCEMPLVHVNSWHHQAVKRLGDGFRASGHAPDGVIEAIESKSHRFAVGVQWHPERLWDKDIAARRLFEGLVRACMRGS